MQRHPDRRRRGRVERHRGGRHPADVPHDLARRRPTQRLEPQPGAGPTTPPNAVSVDLADDGTFQVFNLQGTVHLVVDLVGIYQHHDHDDRYYPRAEVDELVVGLEGEPGPQGDRGLSAWDTIPTGVTVTGSWEQRFPATGPNENYSISVPLPARAPRPLTDESVNIASPTGPTPLLVDGDPACTGTVDAPTAPPCKVCLYRSGSGQVGQMYGSNLLHLGETGFRIVWSSRDNTELNTQMYMTLTWAYTAPKPVIRR